MTNLDSRKVKEIAQKYKLELLLLFGSQVKKKSIKSEKTDFDVAYLAKQELSFDEQIKMNCELMEVFGSDKIDMVNLKNANPLLMYQVGQNCRLLYGKKEDFLEFKALAFRVYIDQQDLLELEDYLINKKQNLLKRSLYGG